MRSSKFAIALIVGSFATSTLAQQTLDWPVGELQDYHLDSGVQDNPGIGAETVFIDVIAIRDAAWLRIYFAEVQLGADSFIRFTSLLDHEVQELDANGLAMWDNSSAYFNGNALLVELVAAPGTTKNRFVIDQVAMEEAVALPEGTCGICDADDRVPSDEDWSARLFPAGCTASIWNTESCLVSAGHCIGENMVIQFRVPDSDPDCSTNNPPVADQFPITGVLFVNEGVGNDWSVLTSGTNNLGQTAYERYGEFRPIASSPAGVGDALAVWGFGVDTQCTRSQTQQTAGGSVTQVFSTYFRYDVDVTFGNSGSAVIRNGEILGIVTHCPCPSYATRVDHTNFANAREQLCEGFVEIAKLLPNDGAAGDRFGRSVAISGATAIVGAPLDNDNGSDSGSAYLFDTTTGRQLFKLLPNDGAELDHFGSSVAISGATAIVGANNDDDNGTDSGSAYVFVMPPGGWMDMTDTAKLLPNDGAAGDQFGNSVAISGPPGEEVAIVGAPFDDDNGDASGSAYLFDASACPWDCGGDDGQVDTLDLLILLSRGGVEEVGGAGVGAVVVVTNGPDDGGGAA
ncbi:MAG: trypsin-like serine protease, partial [Phycisphaerales bacterium]